MGNTVCTAYGELPEELLPLGNVFIADHMVPSLTLWLEKGDEGVGGGRGGFTKRYVSAVSGKQTALSMRVGSNREMMKMVIRSPPGGSAEQALYYVDVDILPDTDASPAGHLWICVDVDAAGIANEYRRRGDSALVDYARRLIKEALGRDDIRGFIAERVVKALARFSRWLAGGWDNGDIFSQLIEGLFPTAIRPSVRENMLRALARVVEEYVYGAGEAIGGDDLVYIIALLYFLGLDTHASTLSKRAEAMGINIDPQRALAKVAEEAARANVNGYSYNSFLDRVGQVAAFSIIARIPRFRELFGHLGFAGIDEGVEFVVERGAAYTVSALKNPERGAPGVSLAELPRAVVTALNNAGDVMPRPLVPIFFKKFYELLGMPWPEWLPAAHVVRRLGGAAGEYIAMDIYVHGDLLKKHRAQNAAVEITEAGEALAL